MVYKAGPVLNIHQKSHIKQNSFLTLIQNDIKPELLLNSHLKWQVKQGVCLAVT